MYYFLTQSRMVRQRYGLKELDVVSVPVNLLLPHDPRFPDDPNRLTVLEDLESKAYPGPSKFDSPRPVSDYYGEPMRGTVLRIRVETDDDLPF